MTDTFSYPAPVLLPSTVRSNTLPLGATGPTNSVAIQMDGYCCSPLRLLFASAPLIWVPVPVFRFYFCPNASISTQLQASYAEDGSLQITVVLV